MAKLHNHFVQTYPRYCSWHQTKHHNKIHWGVFGVYIISIFLTAYSYTVSAYDAAGNESGQSESTSAATIVPKDFSVQSIGATSTQAVLSYIAPDTNSCAIEVSESPEYTPLVHDVDSNLFAGSNVDNRDGNIFNGTYRVFVIGKHSMNPQGSFNPFLASDGKRYSRALQADTTHYYRVTCGSKVETGIFKTTNIPLGNTRGEILPYSPENPGKYNWPDLDSTDRNETIIDPATGTLIRKVTLPGDETPSVSFGMTPGGYQNICSNSSIYENGSTYYLCAAPRGGTSDLVSINTDTGAANYLSSIRAYIPELNSTLPCSGWPQFDASNGRQFYCVLGGKKMVLFEWTGALNTSNPTPASGAPHTALTAANLNPSSGANITNLIAAFDPTFDAVQQSYITGCSQTSYQKDHIILSCSQKQDNGAWIAVFNPGNKMPLDAGGTGGIIASFSTLKAPASRWCGLHAVKSTYDTDSWIALSLNSSTARTGILAGPWQVQVAGSGADGAILSTDTVFTIVPQNGIYEPLDPNPASGENAYLQDAQPGDLFRFVGSNEMVELTSKDLANHTWTFLRGSQLNNSPFYQNSGFTVHSFYTNSRNYPSGTRLEAFCRANTLTAPYSGPIVWWDYERDKYGSNLAYPGVSGVSSPEVIEHIPDGGHGIIRNNKYTMYDWKCGPVSGSCWTTREGQLPDIMNRMPNIYTSENLMFENIKPAGGSDAYQNHISFHQINAPDTEKVWFLDMKPLGFARAAYGISNLVSGTSNVYKVTGTTLHREQLPTLASAGINVLRDISSSAVGDIITDAMQYTYCVANKAGECRANSITGDVYVSAPGVNYPSSTNAECYNNALPNVSTVDICVGDIWARGHMVGQFGFSQTDINGELSRNITQAFYQYHDYRSQYDNAKATPDGKWVLFKAGLPARSDIFMAKLPPFPAIDGVKRDGFISIPIDITVPSGVQVDNAIVEFGYAENGRATDFYCTTRQETCVKGNQAGNIYGYASDSVVGVPCASGCTINVPAIPQRMVYLRVKYRDSLNNVVSTGITRVAVAETPFNISEPDVTSPTQPNNLAAITISSTQINLSWSAATDNVGVAGYKIYRDGVLVTSHQSPVTSYSDTNLQPSAAYTYTVSAYDAASNESAQSTPLSVTTLASFKQSDLNQDGKTDQLDFDILKQDYSRTDKPPADLNQDGIVDARDLGILMGEWGR